ncbi:MAG: DUF3352 domain-containing protein [Solirubrobacterales bacterium]
MIPDRLAELWEDLRWGARRIVDRLRRGPTAPPTRSQVIRRRRAVALLGLAVCVYAIFRFVPVPGLPCDVSPAKTCIPTDDAIALVPAGAQAYLQIELDPDSTQFSTAEDVASRLPHFDQILQGVFNRLGPAPGLDLRREVGGWLGEEAAVALVGRGQPQPLALLAIGDEAGARRFAAGLAEGRPRRIAGGETPIRAYRNGLAFAELGGFLALGTVSSVRAAGAASAGRGRALADSEAADAALDPLPDLRLAHAYLSPRGIKRQLAGRGGLASQLDPFVDFSASRGLGAALVADQDGFELALESNLDPRKLNANPTFFQTFPSFDPSLAGEFSPETLLYLDIADPAQTVLALLRQASRTAPSLVGAFNRFEGQLSRAGVDFERGVLPLLGGEAAVGVALGPRPNVTGVFTDIDEGRAREEIARLQVPLIAALSPARTGQAPSFEAERIGDVVMRSVRLSPRLNLAYAIFDGKLVVSSSPQGVRQAVEGEDSLAGTEPFQGATKRASGGVSALVFLSLEGLVRRAEPLGLDRIVRGFAEDISRLRGLGVSVKSDEDSLNTTFFLDIE